MDRRKSHAVLLTLCAAALWGTTFPAVKVGLEYVNPFNFLMWRFFLATIVLLIVQMLRGTSISELIRPETVSMGFVMSLSFLMQYLGQVGTTASEAAVLINSSPVMVPMLGYALIKERLNAKKWSAVVLGTVGVILMSGIAATNGNGGYPVIGTIELLFSALLTSIFIVVSKKNVAVVKPLDIILGSFIFASLFIFMFTLLSGNVSLSLWNSYTTSAIVIYLSLFCTALPFILWFRGLGSLSATGSTVITLFEPVVGVALSIVFLGEAFTVLAAAGTSLIFIAIVLMGTQ